jgi:arylsulfatase A-like enzyme
VKYTGIAPPNPRCIKNKEKINAREGREVKQRPNIILMVMDTVRADHLSSYGYHRKTTPNIDKLAKQGVLFENAFSPATWTPPSHASIFSGKYPFQHNTLGKDARFKEEASIAEVLRCNSYQTIGITDCAILSPQNGFNKGFQEYINTSEISLASLRFLRENFKDVIRTLIRGPDSHTYRINEIIKRLLSNRNYRKKPFFLFINYFNCHIPYNPPKPFKKKLFVPDSDLDSRKLKHIASGKSFSAFMKKGLQISWREWEVVKSWYDGEIAYLDSRIGELLKFLHSEGFLDNTFLIITSDHGEYFGEHGLAGHVFGLYDELLHVPLIMVYPDEIPKGIRISNIVSTIDIFPTIMDLLDIKTPKNKLSKSLRAFEDRSFHDFILAESEWQVSKGKPSPKIHARCKCIRTTSYKYINWLDLGEEELYDLRCDPFERVNVACKYPKKSEYFRKQLQKIFQMSDFGPKTHILENKKMLKRLKDLGYI